MSEENKAEEEHLKLVRLSEDHKDILANFDCLDPNEVFSDKYNSKHRKKFRQHSKDINDFLKDEALQEQNEGLNTTHLLFYEGYLAGFISLCTDSIRLAIEEREEDGVPYANIPAIKIARLAIDNKFHGKKLGKFLIDFSVSVSMETRNNLGIKFITVDCYEHRLSYYEKNKFVQNKEIVKNRNSTDSPYSLRLNIDKYLEDYYVSD